MSFSELVGRVAFITGSSSGIGRAIALLFARNGASLALMSRGLKGLEETLHMCENEGAKSQNILLIAGDVSNEKDCIKAISETVRRFGDLHILVNCAAVFHRDSIESVGVEGNIPQFSLQSSTDSSATGGSNSAVPHGLSTFDTIMAINVRGPLALMHLATPHLIKTKGCIVNVTGIMGARAFPNRLSYSISKAALQQLTACAAIDLASKGVRVNAVCPGHIDTPILLHSGQTEETNEEYKALSRGIHPLGRIGTPEEVAEAVLFLATRATFTTGASLPVDSGRGVQTPYLK
jgi:NAD(P)-dependent dehydrogenase (short-subunit alcohol dehydrogenase family)